MRADHLRLCYVAHASCVRTPPVNLEGMASLAVHMCRHHKAWLPATVQFKTS